MISKFTLTYGEWKKISLAGQTGTAWLKSYNGLNPIIKIAHTGSSQPVNDDIPIADAVDLAVDESYRLPVARISDILTPDNENDIFYATIRNTAETCEIITDFTTV